MKLSLRELFCTDGTVNRLTYLAVGVTGILIKFAVDSAVAQLVFHREWSLFFYWFPLGYAAHLRELRGSSPDVLVFLCTMAGVALPFIWVGTTMTLRRLRDAGWPAWMLLFFFLPFVNLLFFAVLCVANSRPPAPKRQEDDRGTPDTLLGALIPRGATGSAAVACLVTTALGLLAVPFSTTILRSYGWGLFVAGPFSLGLIATVLYGYHQPRAMLKCLYVATVATLMAGAAFLLVAIEGLICLLMALPIALPLAWFGAIIGYSIQSRRWNARQAPATLCLVLALVPGMMALEAAEHRKAPLFPVTTSIEINAPPSVVWKQVVSFSEITEPPEWVFHAGIAYPQRAEIFGTGPGAVRHCVFSTGPFVEPITVWDEPRLLQFTVTQTPPPMHELSPYGQIAPPHLEGYMVSRQGQFLLVPLPGARTRLEGTTWYQHGLWPAEYWRLWSDLLIHRIHLRVLRHIKREAEAGASQAAAR
jgi:uncharacterized membrane protein YhaH (DUF805 family)